MEEPNAGASGEQWRFKENGMVFGPVPARLVLEKLYAGELGPETPIAREEEESFRNLRDVAFFTVHLAKAQAKLRVERDEGAIDAVERRGRRARFAVIAGLLVSALALAGGGTAFFVLRRQRALQREVDDIPIVSNPPELAAARRSTSDDEVTLPAAGSAAQAHHGRRAPSAAAAPTDEIAQPRYDKGSIIAAEVRQKSALIPCIKQELGRSPGFRGEIHFTVAIGNEGRVAKLWMDDAQFKEGPLQGCFWKTMAQWHFSAYQGERATLSDSFHVGH